MKFADLFEIEPDGIRGGGGGGGGKARPPARGGNAGRPARRGGSLGAAVARNLRAAASRPPRRGPK